MRNPSMVQTSLKHVIRFICQFAVFLVLGQYACGGDSLVVSDSVGPAGTTVNLVISLKTSSVQVSGLQWEISVPQGALFGVSSSLREKTLACNEGHCLLIGKRVVIPSGPVAVLAVNLPKAASGRLTISLTNVTGVLTDGSARKISGSSSVIVVGSALCPKCDCAEKGRRSP